MPPLSAVGISGLQAGEDVKQDNHLLVTAAVFAATNIAALALGLLDALALSKVRP